METGTARSDVADLQRQTIASLRQCADAAVDLAELLGDAACPRDMTCLRDWSRRPACFEAEVGKFLDQASQFLSAVMLSAAPRALGRARAGARACDAFPGRASFTEAQERVFELLVTGLPNKLIAYEVGVSEATVKAHVSAVLRKLGVHSRAQAIALSSAFERNRDRQAPSA